MKRLLLVGVIFPVAAALVFAQAGVEIEVLQLRPTVWMIAGAGANVGVQVGEDGVIVIDSGAAANASAVLAAIKKISTAPIRYVINTTFDADHVGGNEAISKAGLTLLSNRVTGLNGNFNGAGPASILSMEQVLARMSAPTGQSAAFPVAAWPTETFEFGYRNMYLNGEGIEMLHQPSAHSDGDAFVFFRRSDVIFAGDVLDTTRFPVINTAAGGSIQGEIDALNRLVQMAIPSVPIITREVGTSVIPGHGRICDQFDVVFYRDMVTIIRDRVRDMKAAGMTLAQVQAAQPAKGYMGRYRIEYRRMDDEHVRRGDLQNRRAGEVMKALIALLITAFAVGTSAQGRGAAAAPQRSPREAAPIDITGYWVSYVTEDWRYRMMTPPKGDYARVPLSPAGRKVADGWDPAADKAAGNECKAFGAPALMRVPGRVHITWQDDTTLKIESDAGTQTRTLKFAAPAAAGERTWQGSSVARWDNAAKSLNVLTTNMRSGYLRFNGVPYSENATLTENFDVAPYPDGGQQLLVITTIVTDPQYLNQPFVVSNHFKKEKDGSKWSPTPCTATW